MLTSQSLSLSSNSSVITPLPIILSTFLTVSCDTHASLATSPITPFSSRASKDLEPFPPADMLFFRNFYQDGFRLQRYLGPLKIVKLSSFKITIDNKKPFISLVCEFSYQYLRNDSKLLTYLVSVVSVKDDSVLIDYYWYV